MASRCELGGFGDFFWSTHFDSRKSISGSGTPPQPPRLATYIYRLDCIIGGGSAECSSKTPTAHLAESCSRRPSGSSCSRAKPRRFWCAPLETAKIAPQRGAAAGRSLPASSATYLLDLADRASCGSTVGRWPSCLAEIRGGSHPSSLGGHAFVQRSRSPILSLLAPAPRASILDENWNHPPLVGFV